MKKLFYLLIILISLAWLFLFRPAFLGGPASYIIVSGVSMQPTLFSGDLVVMQRQANYSAGEVIAFRVSGGNVIHRIVGGSAEEGFITQGDNKTLSDPWHPKPEDILGRMWFHISGGGKVLQNLRQPASFIALGGLSAFFFLDDQKKERWEKRGKRMKARLKMSGFQITPPSWTLSALEVTAVLTLLFVAIAIYGFLQPPEKIATVERLRYEHTAAFQYTVHTEPSLLNPKDTIGPIGPGTSLAGSASSPSSAGNTELDMLTPTGETQPAAGPPVFTRLAHSIVLDFAYHLSSQLPAEVQGQVGVDLQIKAGDGWVTTQTLVQPAPFNGTTAETHATLDFQQIRDFLKSVEEQTGYAPGTYELALVPTVHLNGQIGGRNIDDTYTPAFTLSFNQTQIRLDNQLTRSEVRKVEEATLQPNQVRVLGISLPVLGLRLVGLFGAILGLLTSALLAILYMGVGLDDAARLQARYGGLIVPTAVTDLGTQRKVQVASMPDLVRLAQREGSVIFHQSYKGADLYYIPDGQVVYTYLLNKPAKESPGSNS